MIPLRSTQRVRSRTPVVIGLIVLNTAIFLYQATLNPFQLSTLAGRWGIVPDALRIWSLATSMFLHGGWLHLGGNMLFLWVFGRNLEELIGSVRFAAFYLLCGLAAAVIHVIANPYSRIPTIGASGAIAGVMGAYLIKFPRTSIVTLVPIFVFVTTMEIPSFLLLLYWFGMQFLNGVGSLSQVNYAGGGVAWFAHIGGFLVGLAAIRLFPDLRPKWRAWYEED
jgi:membrane associated rhomboid family serine protease